MRLFSSHKNKSDEQLMILVQKGDHHAFSILYNRYADRLNAFFYRMLWSDSKMAEDYVHDLFSKIIERPHLFQQGNKVKPWLFQVASNMCKNGYRKRNFEREYLDQLQASGISESVAEQKVDEKLLTDQVHEALNQLDEDRRTMFLLRFQQELKIEEISIIFEIPEGTVKSRLFHTKQYIAESLKE